MVPTIDQLLHALTRAVNTLADAGIPFAVGGGCAVYARGGPASEHDVDILIKPGDLPQARSTLTRGVLRIADPPEDWLTKVYDDGVLIDLIYRPNNRAVTDELLDRADIMRVGPTTAPVISATDLMIDKLLVFDAHRLDLSPLLTVARDLREQVDWERVRKETDISPYARAFLGLLDDLGVIEPKPVV